MIRRLLLPLLLGLCVACPQDLRYDSDNDGVEDLVDCDPADAARYTGAQDDFGDGIDQDCDGGDGIDRDHDQSAANGGADRDCDDENAEVHPGALDTVGDAVDHDCDGTDGADADRDGFASIASGGADCDDADPARTPVDGDGDGASTCSGDCDDQDAGLQPNDEDGDGVSACDQPADCDDAVPTVRPGLPEACDGLDTDCDGDLPVTELDVDADEDPACADCDDGDEELESLDQDGDGVSTCQGDCVDTIAAVNPYSTDLLGDGIDQNCDDEDGFDGDLDGEAGTASGGADCADNDASVTSMTDNDGDLSGPCAGDCADNNAAVRPGFSEACDGLDTDCDGQVLAEGNTDGDATLDCLDCGPTDPSRHIGATELCDGVDQDCDGWVDDGFDSDGDGSTSCGGDCDDGDPAVEDLDQDGDGFSTCDGDCLDELAVANPFATDLVGDSLDQNCDGLDGSDLDQDGEASVTSGGDDCDDDDDAIHPNATEFCDGVDQDCDGAVDDGFDLDGDLVTVCAGDCDDTNPEAHPSAAEVCDGIDTNCLVDDQDEVDVDGDGWPLCEDCADGDNTRHPEATELCDGIDQDCDTQADEGWDGDGDGFTICSGDCDNFDALTYEGAPEICNGIDENCDESVAAEGDGDGDGFRACAECDDGDDQIYPGATETCDFVDQDCDNVIDDGFDLDNDGFSTCEGDCLDNSAVTYPGAPELCDSLDNDCQGGPASYEYDTDGDGSSDCVDCVDDDPLRCPTCAEVCDGVDNDCDFTIDEGSDLDGDGYASCGGDCDDSSILVNPGRPEICNAVDDDCDGMATGEEDADGDGYPACADCDDGDTAPCATPMIVASGYHTCALLAGGTVRCWGSGSFGRLGYGHTMTLGDDEVPATVGDVDVGGWVVALDIGDRHTCVVLDNGGVRCWGYGPYGALGYDSTTTVGDDEVPASMGDVNVGGPVDQIALGFDHTCALLSGGTVRCWGYASSGQLGYGNTTEGGPSGFGDVPVGGTAVQIAAGRNHTCVLLDTGGVRCWGDGQYGQLGYGNTENIGDDETPASAGDVDIGGPVESISAGGYHTCALLTTGSVRCWGQGELGVLGYGNTQNVGDNESPGGMGDVPVGGDAIGLTVGYSATCAVLPGGLLRCWGSDAQGGLGYGPSPTWAAFIGDDEYPSSVGFVPVGAPVTQVSLGQLHTCVTLASGTMRCWGSGGQGQLGYGDTAFIFGASNAGDIEIGLPLP